MCVTFSVLNITCIGSFMTGVTSESEKMNYTIMSWKILPFVGMLSVLCLAIGTLHGQENSANVMIEQMRQDDRGVNLTYEVSVRDYWMSAPEKTEPRMRVDGVISVQVNNGPAGDERIATVTSRIKSVSTQDKDVPVTEIEDVTLRYRIRPDGILIIDSADDSNVQEHRIFLNALDAIFPALPPKDWRPGQAWIVDRNMQVPVIHTANIQSDGRLLIVGMSSVNLPTGGAMPSLSKSRTSQSVMQDGSLEYGSIVETKTGQDISYRIFIIQRQKGEENRR